MAVVITRTTSCVAPVDVAFGYVADHRNTPDWVLGLTAFTPVGGRDQGLGAVFDASLHLGVRLSARLEIDDFVEGRRMGFASTRGFAVRSRWTFTQRTAAVTTITAELVYRLPFGPAGVALGRVIGPFVQQSLAVSSRQLTDGIETAARRELVCA
jgi:hypothetical protein